MSSNFIILCENKNCQQFRNFWFSEAVRVYKKNKNKNKDNNISNFYFCMFMVCIELIVHLFGSKDLCKCYEQ